MSRAAVLALLLGACAAPPPRSIGAVEEDCASCHPHQAEAFAEGAMADTTGSLVFQALRAEVMEVLGPSAVALCDRCHAPEVGTDHGLSCASCHAAIGNQAPENGLILFDLSGPVRGPTGSADGRSPHDVSTGGFASDSALCGSCHDVRGPAGFEETPFAHWQESEAGALGIGCVDCHMGAVPGVARDAGSTPMGPIADLEGLSERPLTEHRFVGLNRAPDEATALLARAVELQVSRTDGLLVVSLRNINRGHRFPDGASFLRELWVEVADDQGRTLERAWLSTRLTQDGVEVSDPVLADAQVDHAIPAGESRAYEWPAPSEPVSVCVRFRQLRPDLLEHLQLDPDLAGPVHDIACAETYPPEPG